MKFPRIWTALMVFILSGLPLAQTKSDGAEQAIKSMEDQLTQALLKGDVVASEKYLASDYVRVYPDGTYQGTDDLRKQLKFRSIVVSEQQVHVTGDTAVSVFKATLKASAGGQPIEGDFRGVRIWARQQGEWKAVAFSTIQMAGSDSPDVQQPTAEQHVRVEGNVLHYDLSKIKLTLDPKFHYLGSFPFDIMGVAGGYRYIWGETDHGQHLRRTFIVQAEGYYPNNMDSYQYSTPNPATLAGDAYQHNVWVYDNDESARERRGNESDLTKNFMRDHGYEWDSQLIMSRFARIVDESKKNEIILFYFENLADYTAKHVADFPEEGKSPEQQKILNSVEANSSKAFAVAHQQAAEKAR